jgi:hypothetical protein
VHIKSEKYISLAQLQVAIFFKHDYVHWLRRINSMAQNGVYNTDPQGEEKS